jgi:hypothetical protein
MRKLIIQQVHCHLDGQITKFGYTEIKPSTVVKNETSLIASFPRRQSSLLRISPLQFLTTNFYKPDECQYDISFYVNDGKCLSFPYTHKH